MDKCRSAYVAHQEMQAGAAALHSQTQERADWMRVLCERDERRAARRTQQREQALKRRTGFGRVLSALFH